MVVTVVTEPEFNAQRPRLLFEGRYDIARVPGGDQNFDVTPDGRSILALRSPEQSARIVVVRNLAAELRQRFQSAPR